MAKKAATSGNGGTATAAKPAAKSTTSAKAVTKEAGSSVGADKPAKASKGNGAATLPVDITEAMIAEAAYFLHVNGVPGTPEEHWATAEAQLRSNSAAPL